MPRNSTPYLVSTLLCERIYLSKSLRKGIVGWGYHHPQGLCVINPVLFICPSCPCTNDCPVLCSPVHPQGYSSETSSISIFGCFNISFSNLPDAVFWLIQTCPCSFLHGNLLYSITTTIKNGTSHPKSAQWACNISFVWFLHLHHPHSSCSYELTIISNTATVLRMRPMIIACMSLPLMLPSTGILFCCLYLINYSFINNSEIPIFDVLWTNYNQASSDSHYSKSL